MRRQYFKREYFIEARGFTLLEGLISASIFLLVMFAIYSTFASSAGTFAKGDTKADIHQNTRASMEFMVREIRHAGYFPENFSPLIIPLGPAAGCPGPFVGISNATATSITICGDVDGDNGSELVTYTWVGDTNGDNIVDPGENEIRRQVTDDGGLQPADVMALNISAFTFSYIDRANNVINPDPGDCSLIGNTTPPCDIARVLITMTGSEPVSQSAAIGGRSHNPFATRVPNFQLVTDVRPRNLGL
ncbi:MAG: PilW family protein [Candidatus Methylomirabilales bacterium]